MEKDFLKVLACPGCKGKLKMKKQESLVCESCKVKFKIEEGVPILISEKAEKF